MTECGKFFFLVTFAGNVHKGRPTIMGYFGHTYLPMSDVFYTAYYHSLIFAEIPTYPKIGRPLWTFSLLEISRYWQFWQIAFQTGNFSYLSIKKEGLASVPTPLSLISNFASPFFLLPEWHEKTFFLFAKIMEAKKGRHFLLNYFKLSTYLHRS